jgi:CheY-like chemotaxis protein
MPNSAPNLSGLRALVVDDQPDARDLLAAILSMKEAEVRTAGSVAEAMKILSAWQPEIMISDIAMPEGGGYELIQRVRSVGNKIPAIALTAHASAEERIQALAAASSSTSPNQSNLTNW